MNALLHHVISMVYTLIDHSSLDQSVFEKQLIEIKKNNPAISELFEVFVCLFSQVRMARALWFKYILCHSKDQRSFLWLIIHYTIPCFGTIYTIELHTKGFQQNQLLQLTMVAHWVGQKCGPVGKDRSRHAGIYAMLQWLGSGQVCLNLCPWMMPHRGRMF